MAEKRKDSLLAYIKEYDVLGSEVEAPKQLQAEEVHARAYAYAFYRYKRL